MRWWRSMAYIRWWQTEATPEQKHIMRNIQSRKRFDRWACNRCKKWGVIADSLLTSVMLLVAVEGVLYLIYLLGKVIWWH